MSSYVNPPDPQMILETLSERYGQPFFCFFFGSHAFDRGDAGSDIDVIVVLSRVVHAYRETFSSNGFLFDANVQDPETLHCMMRLEHKNGLAMLAGEVVQARVLPEPCELASKLKEVARELIRSGPPPFPSWAMPRRHVTAVLSDLERCADANEQWIMAMDLYIKLMDIYLRCRGQLLAGQVRYLVRSARTLDPTFVDRAQSAMARLFQDGSVSPLTELAREVIDVIGGPLSAGYRENYSEKLRLALP
jgi:hypothetical protein